MSPVTSTLIAASQRKQVRWKCDQPSASGATFPGATKTATPVRVQKTPGRNDLCWCGSGKKYKHCHMKSDLAGGNGQNMAQVNQAQAKAGGRAKKRKKARR